jgi:uncharacterized protein involved in type VI secretion and phage assembly
MSSPSDAAFNDLLDRTTTRFYGKYAGTVTEVDEDTMRLRAKVPGVFGDQPCGWATACVPYAGKGYGIAFLPEVGSGVWIEFEAGETSRPIWSGCYWREGETPPDAAAAVKVIQTKEGAKIVFDDEEKSITISDSNGNEIKIDDSGIKLSRSSMTVEITESSVKINDSSLEVT